MPSSPVSHADSAPGEPDRHVPTVRVPTRWMDNDVYGHVNNTVHYLAMDTAVNAWLIEHGLDIERGPVIGLVVESGCRYLASLSYPDALVLTLRVSRLGTSSVQWEIGMARESDGEPVAEGRFVHVFVDRVTRKPTAVPAALRAHLEPLVTTPATP